MAVSVSLRQNIVVGGREIAKANEYSDEAVIEMNFDSPADAADEQIDVALVVAQAKLIYIVSDQDVELEEPADGSNVDITLLAGVPLVWTDDGYHVNLFTGDFTALFFTAVEATAANVYLVIVYDASQS